MVNYTVWLKTDRGEPLVLLDRHYGFSYVKTLNGAGWFSLKYPDETEISPGILLGDSLTVDRQIQFWRQEENQTTPKLDFFGFLRKWSFSGSDDSLLTLSGPDQNDLLNRRIIAYDDESAEAITSGYGAGSVQYLGCAMLDIVDENMGAQATAARDITGNDFTIESTANQLIGPAGYMRYPWRDVSKTLTDLNQLSRHDGTEVFYGVFVTGINNDGTAELEFKIFVDPPGGDRSWQPNPLGKTMVFGLRWGNLLDPFLEYDYTNEFNVLYVGGESQGAQREVVTVENTDRSGASIWNRREKFIDGRGLKDTNELTDYGNHQLENYRPVIRFRGKILSTEQTPYGEWGLGTRVTVEHKNRSFNGIIRNVQISVDENGVETATSNVEFESML